MGKINKPVVDGISNRFFYRGSEYDIRQTNLGLQLYKDNRFYRNIPQYSNESITIDDIINDLENLKNNETVYQVYEYVGTSTTGQISIPEGAAIFDLYGDGEVDAILVEANVNQTPTENNSRDSEDIIIQVDSLDNDGNYSLSSIPIKNSCILYYVIIRDELKSNVPLSSIIDGFSYHDISNLLRVNYTGDDAGIDCLGQLSIGLPGEGRELVAGEGDSYPIGEHGSCTWHCDIANTTGNTIVNATDVCSILGSETGSTTGLFGGILSGDYILLGSDHTYGGVKVKIAQDGVIEPQNIVAEYLVAGTTWYPVPFMASRATEINSLISQYGWNIAANGLPSEQWRFGFDPENYPPPWSKVTINVNGVDYTKYWSRFRIATDITQDAIIEQLKVHTNRWECNEDGSTEHFGRSRYPKVLQAGIRNLVVNIAGSAQNQNVSYTPNIVAERRSNVFRDGFQDDALIVQTLPTGLDTSIPLTIAVSYYPVNANSGDIEFYADVVKVSDGFVYNGLASSTRYTKIETIPGGTALLRYTSIIKIFVNDLTDQAGIVIRLSRNAAAGNTNDTLLSNIVLTHFELVGHFWKP